MAHGKSVHDELEKLKEENKRLNKLLEDSQNDLI